MAKRRHSADRRDILNETERQVRQQSGYPDKIYHRSETVSWWALFRDAFSCGVADLHDEKLLLGGQGDNHRADEYFIAVD